MTPEIRKQYGVYATPGPLVGFMVRSVHVLLQTKLGMLGGLADPEVRLLDPAAGTGNFLRAAGWHAIEHYMSCGGDPREIVRDHLPPCATLSRNPSSGPRRIWLDLLSERERQGTGEFNIESLK